MYGPYSFICRPCENKHVLIEIITSVNSAKLTWNALSPRRQTRVLRGSCSEKRQFNAQQSYEAPSPPPPPPFLLKSLTFLGLSTTNWRLLLLLGWKGLASSFSVVDGVVLNGPNVRSSPSPPLPPHLRILAFRRNTFTSLHVYEIIWFNHNLATTVCIKICANSRLFIKKIIKSLSLSEPLRRHLFLTCPVIMIFHFNFDLWSTFPMRRNSFSNYEIVSLSQKTNNSEANYLLIFRFRFNFPENFELLLF